MFWLWYVIAGLFGGIVGGMGMGGGTLLIPIMTLFLGIDQHLSQAINLLVFIPTGILAVIIHAKNKLIAAKSEKLDVFIDDSFQNCKMVSSAGIKTFIMDTRVNKGLKDDKIERIYSWPHLYMKLKKLENYN